MEIFRLIIALLIPWALGYAWIRLLWGQQSPFPHSNGSDVFLILGYGYPAGIIFTTFVMRLTSQLGFQLDFTNLTITLCILTFLAVIIRNKAQQTTTISPTNPSFHPLPTWQKAVIALLLSLLVIRFSGSLLEVLWRPLYPWDAWMNFAPKARIWFELNALVPIVDSKEWLQDSSGAVYTVGAIAQRPTVSLIHTWMALGLGRWNDTLINIPWIICGISLGLAFYGQARLLGVNAITAVVFVYLILSMPYTDVNLILAGYAEPWVAATFTMASMSFIHWIRTQDPRQGFLTLLFIILCTQIKISSMAWALVFVPAIAIYWLPRKALVAILLVCIVGISYILAAGGIEYQIPRLGWLRLTPDLLQIPYLGSLEFHPVWNAFLDNDFVFSNWHLFWYAFFPIFFYGLISGRAFTQYMRPATVLVLACLGFLFIVYFFTNRYQWAEDSTQINRALFHITPTFGFYIMTLFLYPTDFYYDKPSTAREKD